MAEYKIENIRTENWEMNCIRFGNGSKSFVVIPGLSMKSILVTAMAIANKFKGFLKDYTVYVFDRRENPPQNYTIRQMAEDTACAMKRLGIKSADIFGASQGGMIAQYLAIDFPELVHALVLCSTLSRQNETVQKRIGYWAKLARLGDYKALNHDIFMNVYSEQFLEPFKNSLEALENDGSIAECDRLAILAQACLEMNCYDELDRINCPVLVVGVKGDRVLSGEASVELAEKLNCPLYMYEGYGHAVYDEAEDFEDRILDFFMSASE